MTFDILLERTGEGRESRLSDGLTSNGLRHLELLPRADLANASRLSVFFAILYGSQSNVDPKTDFSCNQHTHHCLSEYKANPLDSGSI